MVGGSMVEARCAMHPARPTLDECPRCARPRCGPDAAEYAERGCGACAEPLSAAPPAPTAERLVRAGFAAFVIALLGGWIGTQYVGVQNFSVVAPGLVGLAAAWTAGAAAGAVTDNRLRRQVLLIAALAAVLSAALAFRLDSGGGENPVGSWSDDGPPYLAAIIGTLLWPVVFGPPRRKKRVTGDRS